MSLAFPPPAEDRGPEKGFDPTPPARDASAGWGRLLATREERRALKSRAQDPARDLGELAHVFAQCFGAPAGQRAIAYLRQLTFERCVAPGKATSEELWHREGQRCLVLTIEQLIRNGKEPRHAPASVQPNS